MKVAVLGFGLGGSKLAEAIATKFNTTAIGLVNLSEQDLESSSVPKNNRVCLTPAKSFGGAGKDRNVAKDLIPETMDEIIAMARKVCQGVDIIFPCFGMAGGTGSGYGPSITAFLQSDEVRKSFGGNPIVIGIGLLPDFKEGVRSMTNTAECLEEIHILAEAQVASFALVSNQYSSEEKLESKYMEINAATADTLFRYLEVFGTSRVSNLDGADRVAGLKIPGIHSFLSLDENNVPISPFHVPEGARVKLLLSEVPEERSDAMNHLVALLAIHEDDRKEGFFDKDLANPIVHLAGFNTASKIAESFRLQLKQLQSRGMRQENTDKSGKGFEGLDKEAAWKKEQYAQKSAASPQGVLDLLSKNKK